MITHHISPNPLRTDCSISPLDPGCYSRDWMDVTCADCLARRPYRAQHGHPLHRDHTEDLETGIASAVREIDEMRAENERLRAAIGRVQELAADLENAPQVGYDSSEQWEFDTRRIIAQELRRALEGDHR